MPDTRKIPVGLAAAPQDGVRQNARANEQGSSGWQDHRRTTDAWSTALGQWLLYGRLRGLFYHHGPLRERARHKDQHGHESGCSQVN